MILEGKVFHNRGTALTKSQWHRRHSLTHDWTQTSGRTVAWTWTAVSTQVPLAIPQHRAGFSRRRNHLRNKGDEKNGCQSQMRWLAPRTKDCERRVPTLREGCACQQSRGETDARGKDDRSLEDTTQPPKEPEPANKREISWKQGYGTGGKASGEDKPEASEDPHLPRVKLQGLVPGRQAHAPHLLLSQCSCPARLCSWESWQQAPNICSNPSEPHTGVTAANGPMPRTRALCRRNDKNRNIFLQHGTQGPARAISQKSAPGEPLPPGPCVGQLCLATHSGRQ